MRQTEEWERGDTAQRQWADILRDRGNCVLPTYAFEDVTPETKAPVMLVPGGVRITPDVLSFRMRSHATWHEVKSKSVPSWYRRYQRWEHGCDYSLLQEYCRVESETSTPVYIIVHEVASPADPENESLLVPSGIWFCIRLARAQREGEHRPDWPGGKAEPLRRGRDGMGGMLWPRNAMSRIDE